MMLNSFEERGIAERGQTGRATASNVSLIFIAMLLNPKLTCMTDVT